MYVIDPKLDDSTREVIALVDRVKLHSVGVRPGRQPIARKPRYALGQTGTLETIDSFEHLRDVYGVRHSPEITLDKTPYVWRPTS